MIVDVAGGAVAAKLFNGLVRFGEGSEIIPDLAEGYTVSRDGRVYTFRLKKGVRFHNGRELRAADVKYSFERVLDPKTGSPRTWLLDRITGAREFMEGADSDVKGIRVLDEYTVEIVLGEPFGPFLNLLGMPSAYIVPREEIEKGEFPSHPVGTGPFKLKDWKRGRELVILANEGHFSGRPNVNGIVYRIIPEELTTIAEFESGNLDIIGLPSTEFKRYSESPKWRGLIKKAPGLNTFYLGFNCQRPPFNDRRVRQALNYAVDRERILKTILEGRGELARGPVPTFLKIKTTPHLNPLPLMGEEGKGVPSPLAGEGQGGGYSYNPEKARSLLKEAGYENLRFKIYQSADQETVDIMEVVQQYLKKVGVEAEIVQLEWSAFKDAVNKGEADSFWLSWRADYPDPENFLFPVFHSSNWGPAGNRARFSDKGFDRLIEDAQKEPGKDRREELYMGAENRVIEEAPWLFFWHRNDYIIHQPWVSGVKLYPIYNADKGTDVGLAEVQ
jgi:peptide/nickel transport system substrate-binding protein/oligopeptide transport system substrate-binding protein